MQARKYNDNAASLSRRGFLKTSALTTAGLAFPGLLQRSFAADEKKPNIILILADDLGAECLNCYGGTSYQTPHLNAMAAGGIRFDHCYSTPLCSPSRVTAMTGRYGFRTGWTNLIGRRGVKSDFFDPTEERTFAHMLKDAGYATAIAGKWQLARFDQHPDHLRQCGFDEHCCWTWTYGKGKRSRYWSPSIWQDGKVRQEAEDRYGPDIFCDFMLNFIERNKDRPFFAYYPMVLTHQPFLATPDSDPGKSKTQSDDANFADSVAYMDKLVGRIVDKIKELRLEENTLILFTGDNGTDRGITSNIGDRQITGGKAELTNAGTHVPLIAAWKGTAPAGQASDDLVDFTDFLPTFAKVSRAKPPAGVVIDGQSFAPQLRGQRGRPREWVHTQLEDKLWVRDQNWKLYGDGRLYDMKNDPSEKNPIPADTNDKEAAAARQRFTGVLADLK